MTSIAVSQPLQTGITTSMKSLMSPNRDRDVRQREFKLIRLPGQLVKTGAV